MQQFDLREVALQRLGKRPRQHRHAVVCSFPIAHGNLMIGEVEIVHAQTHAFHQAQTGPVEQTRHEIVYPTELREHGFNFILGKDGWHALRTFGPLDLTECRKRLLQYMPVEKEESV